MGTTNQLSNWSDQSGDGLLEPTNNAEGVSITRGLIANLVSEGSLDIPRVPTRSEIPTGEVGFFYIQDEELITYRV